MSINITVTIPLEAVAAIHEAVSKGNDCKALELAAGNTSRAIVNAVKDLPYELKPKSVGVEIRVQVNTYTGKTLSLQINSKAKASELGEMVEGYEGIRLSKQILFFQGTHIMAVGKDDSVDGKLDEASILWAFPQIGR